MACRSCSRQLRLVQRQTTALATAAENRSFSASRGATAQIASGIASSEQRRAFRDTRISRQQEEKPESPSLFKNPGEALRNMFARSAQPYRVISATDMIYKACAREAAYTIPKEQIKNGTIPKTEAGEDLGVGGGMWHTEFNLPPTFSTWSHVTMIHMYLVYARLRNLDLESARSWQAQLTDHFFFDAEEKMDLWHGISSRGLRQRYLKDLFIQWRGIIAAYDEGVIKGDAVLAAAVWRNIFKAREDVDIRAVAAIVSWMRLCLKMLDQMPDELLYTQTPTAFKWPAKNELTLVDQPVRELRTLLEQSAPAKPSTEAAAKAA